MPENLHLLFLKTNDILKNHVLPLLAHSDIPKSPQQSTGTAPQVPFPSTKAQYTSNNTIFTGRPLSPPLPPSPAKHGKAIKLNKSYPARAARFRGQTSFNLVIYHNFPAGRGRAFFARPRRINYAAADRAGHIIDRPIRGRNENSHRRYRPGSKSATDCVPAMSADRPTQPLPGEIARGAVKSRGAPGPRVSPGLSNLSLPGRGVIHQRGPGVYDVISPIRPGEPRLSYGFSSFPARPADSSFFPAARRGYGRIR